MKSSTERDEVGFLSLLFEASGSERVECMSPRLPSVRAISPGATPGPISDLREREVERLTAKFLYFSITNTQKKLNFLEAHGEAIVSTFN